MSNPKEQAIAQDEYEEVNETAKYHLKSGDIIDALDHAGVWNVATIMRVINQGESIEVTYDGWPHYYDEILDIESERVAPFHTYTYTVKCWTKYKNWPWWPSLITIRSPGTAVGMENLREERRLLVDMLDHSTYYKRCRCWLPVSKIRSFQHGRESWRKQTTGVDFENAFGRLCLSRATNRMPTFVKRSLPKAYAGEPAPSVYMMRKDTGRELWKRNFRNNRQRHQEYFQYDRMEQNETGTVDCGQLEESDADSSTSGTPNKKKLKQLNGLASELNQDDIEDPRYRSPLFPHITIHRDQFIIDEDDDESKKRRKRRKGVSTPRQKPTAQSRKTSPQGKRKRRLAYKTSSADSKGIVEPEATPGGSSASGIIVVPRDEEEAASASSEHLDEEYAPEQEEDNPWVNAMASNGSQQPPSQEHDAILWHETGGSNMDELKKKLSIDDAYDGFDSTEDDMDTSLPTGTQEEKEKHGANDKDELDVQMESKQEHNDPSPTLEMPNDSASHSFLRPIADTPSTPKATATMQSLPSNVQVTNDDVKVDEEDASSDPLPSTSHNTPRLNKAESKVNGKVDDSRATGDSNSPKNEQEAVSSEKDVQSSSDGSEGVESLPFTQSSVFPRMRADMLPTTKNKEFTMSGKSASLPAQTPTDVDVCIDEEDEDADKHELEEFFESPAERLSFDSSRMFYSNSFRSSSWLMHKLSECADLEDA